MKSALWIVALMLPTLASAQFERKAVEKRGWVSGHFQLDACAVSTRDDGSFQVSAGGTPGFDGEEGGVDFAIETSPGGAPAVAAHAINTKGTGATNGRATAPTCSITPHTPVPAPIMGKHIEKTGPSCSVSGNADAPRIDFTIPLSAFAAGAGRVVVFRRDADAAVPAVATMTVVSNCNPQYLKAEPGVKAFAYDIAIAKAG